MMIETKGCTAALLSLLLGCPQTPTDSPADAGDSPIADAGVTTDAGAPRGDCWRLGLPTRSFDPTAPTAFQRRQPAGDFTIELRDGTQWNLQTEWSGCDSYIFLTHDRPISQLNNASVWTTDVLKLLEESPYNTHYFFVARGEAGGPTAGYGRDLEARIDEALSAMPENESDWWREHVHVARMPSRHLQVGLIKSMFETNVSQMGFAIDRFQKIRGLGNLADVTAYNQALKDGDHWPWENRLWMAKHEADYFNFEAEREIRLEAQNATVIEVFDGSVIEEFSEGTLRLPDAATMAGFDSMEIDVVMECPNRDATEQGNCGAWDYLAHFYILDGDGETWLEAARFITTYHRESRWVVDASFALGWLQSGGERQIKYNWAPSWNKQPTGVTLRVRLFNQGKGVRPVQVLPLFTGGSFNSAYNTREPVRHEIPAGAAKVELVAITTGHGMDTQNCAEFCRHSHHYSVGDETFDQIFNEPGDQEGCAKDAVNGTVPNQSGTWWFGRGGWCPGRRVDPFIADVTAQAPAGAAATFTYQAKINNRAPFDDAGNMKHKSWLVIYQ
jgi:hypothetical protein